MKPKKPMESLLLTRRGPKVILAAGWAELYGVANRLRPRLAASRASTPKTNNTRTETQLLPARGRKRLADLTAEWNRVNTGVALLMEDQHA